MEREKNLAHAFLTNTQVVQNHRDQVQFSRLLEGHNCSLTTNKRIQSLDARQESLERSSSYRYATTTGGVT